MGIARDWLLAADPVRFSQAAGLEHLDPWQQQLLRSQTPRLLVLASRQAGKSETAACLAAHTATYTPGSLTLVVSPTERQSAEVLLKVRRTLTAVGWPVPAEAEGITHLTLANSSRVIALPGKEGNVRGFTADLLLLDESARIPDSLWTGVRPMLAVSGGRLVAVSTPWGRRGWFYDAWVSQEPYERYKVTAYEVPRISADFLAEEERTLGPLLFQSEYLCEFVDPEGAIFRSDEVAAAIKEYDDPWNLDRFLPPLRRPPTRSA